ncbi:MAG: LPS assembly protein LptD, partial [Methylomonas sp.]|nr:LPS assembly protein LptD [Methylomonas sp.]
FYSLFRENRFSGKDRIQDANQITLAGTTRLIDSETGLEPLKLSLGQVIYFQNRSVDLDYLSDSRAAETSNTSNFIGELSGQLSRHLTYSTGAQWDPLANGFSRTQALLKYRNQPDQIFDIGYRWRNYNPAELYQLYGNDISQSDISFRWPLAAGWYGLGRWQYAFNFGKTTESFIGIEKETCCWRLRVIGRHYINGATNTNILDPDAKAENAVFVQLELKGLVGFGNKVDQFLQRTLNGYQPSSYFDDE